MENYELKYLESEFERYKKLDRLIAQRKVELATKEQDTNMGGGSSNLPSSPTEITAVKNLTDNKIRKLEERKREVERAWARMNDEQRKICEMKFWSDNYYTWAEMADIFHYSVRTMYNKRDKILTLLAEEQGRL